MDSETTRLFSRFFSTDRDSVLPSPCWSRLSGSVPSRAPFLGFLGNFPVLLFAAQRECEHLFSFLLMGGLLFPTPRAEEVPPFYYRPLSLLSRSLQRSRISPGTDRPPFLTSAQRMVCLLGCWCGFLFSTIADEGGDWSRFPPSSQGWCIPFFRVARGPIFPQRTAFSCLTYEPFSPNQSLSFPPFDERVFSLQLLVGVRLFFVYTSFAVLAPGGVLSRP